MPLSNTLALDVGEKRVGLAYTRPDVRVPMVLAALERQASDFWQQLKYLIDQYEIKRLVIGLPRGLDGQETAQTKSTRTFAAELKQRTGLPIIWQDEALTSYKAETLLESAGKPYAKADVDSLAASLILGDYITEEVSQ